MPALAFEVRRVAAGILATRGGEGGIEYARLVNSAGSSLLAGKSVPTLATIGKDIAINREGDRWKQVSLSKSCSQEVVEAAKRVYIQFIQLPKQLGSDASESDSDDDLRSRYMVWSSHNVHSCSLVLCPFYTAALPLVANGPQPCGSPVVKLGHLSRMIPVSSLRSISFYQCHDSFHSS